MILLFTKYIFNCYIGPKYRYYMFYLSFPDSISQEVASVNHLMWPVI